MSIREKVDGQGLRTHCQHCGNKLLRRSRMGVPNKSEKCQKCKKTISIDPMLDLPYDDTRVPIHQSQSEIADMMEEMGLSEISWGTKYHDNAKQYTLSAYFNDGTGFYKEFPVIVKTNENNVEKQIMRVFYHYIKAVVVSYKLDMMTKAEMFLGLLKGGDTNRGSVGGSENERPSV